jgi:hypothetical protein
VRLADFLRDQASSSKTSTAQAAARAAAAGRPEARRRPAGREPGPEEDYFSRRFGDLLHVDDPERIDLLLKVAEPAPEYRPQGEHERRLLQMLAYQRLSRLRHQPGALSLAVAEFGRP